MVIHPPLLCWASHARWLGPPIGAIWPIWLWPKPSPAVKGQVDFSSNRGIFYLICIYIYIYKIKNYRTWITLCQRSIFIVFWLELFLLIRTILNLEFLKAKIREYRYGVFHTWGYPRMDVSKGKSHWSGCFWGTPIFLELRIWFFEDKKWNIKKTWRVLEYKYIRIVLPFISDGTTALFCKARVSSRFFIFGYMAGMAQVLGRNWGCWKAETLDKSGKTKT